MNTMQQEFDDVVTHLFTQGRPAKDGRACLYRTPTGLSCAVGCRIPDEMYDLAMDHGSYNGDTGLTNLLAHFREKLPKEIYAYRGMFNDLQEIHDFASVDGEGKFYLDNLARRLAEVARKRGLTITLPEGVHV
jgi:hypothetical protein